MRQHSMFYAQYLYSGSEQNHKKFLTGQPASHLKTEPDISSMKHKCRLKHSLSVLAVEM